MHATTEENVVTQKTQELCRVIVDQPEFRAIRLSIETFLNDETAKGQYQRVMEQGDSLQQKQHSGGPLDGGEIADFERNRDLLLNNPVARQFLDAQQQMHKSQESVMQYVGKTFELGRVPTSDDFSGGGCGPSCGCDH